MPLVIIAVLPWAPGPTNRIFVFPPPSMQLLVIWLSYA